MSFDPTTIQSGASSTMTVKTTASTPDGSYTITIAGDGTYDTSTTFSLTVKGDGGPGPEKCDITGQKYTGNLSSGQSVYQPNNAWYYTTRSQTHNGCIEGPDGANFDLELQKFEGSGWTVVASSKTPGSTESVTYEGGPGAYRFRITSVSGSGAYTFIYNAS